MFFAFHFTVATAEILMQCYISYQLQPSSVHDSDSVFAEF